MATEDLTDEIISNAQGPASAQGDSVSIRQHSIRDQIVADQYLASKDAVQSTTKPSLGIRLLQLRAAAAP